MRRRAAGAGRNVPTTEENQEKAEEPSHVEGGEHPGAVEERSREPEGDAAGARPVCQGNPALPNEAGHQGCEGDAQELRVLRLGERVVGDHEERRAEQAQGKSERDDAARKAIEGEETDGLDDDVDKLG